MTPDFHPDDALTRARELATAGAWAEALVSLEERTKWSPDAIVLRGESLMRVGREREALEWLRQREDDLARGGDRAALRRAVNMIGAAALATGELEVAVGSFGRALDLAAASDDQLILARATNNLGAIANLQGRHDEALAHYRVSLPAFQRIGQRRGLAASYHNMAITYRDLGELDEADEHERRAIEYAEDGIAPRLAAMGLVGRAEIALRRGDARLAEVSARRAVTDLALLNDPLNEGDAWRLVGVACAAQRRDDEAFSAFARALALARMHGHTLNEAECLRDQAEAQFARRLQTAAVADATAALKLFTGLGAVGETRRLDLLLARIAAAER